MEKITRVSFWGRSFIFLKGKRGYYGVEETAIAEGRITRKLDPTRDNLRESLTDCIRAVEIRVKIENLVAGGMSEEAAALEVITG